MTRKESREQAFILLFEYSFSGDSAEELFAIASDAGVKEHDEYCVEVVTHAIGNIDTIDALITKYAKGWSISRISKVALAALRLAIAEIKYIDTIPASVSVNECIDIIKKYASEQDASFANGILGSIIRADGE
ncbi:MAG: transcription antitermination factor NusB [Clostridia bacterium]|nr:transcription antitermination factor NusB [Clostridia bacterium]